MQDKIPKRIPCPLRLRCETFDLETNRCTDLAECKNSRGVVVKDKIESIDSETITPNPLLITPLIQRF